MRCSPTSCGVLPTDVDANPSFHGLLLPAGAPRLLEAARQWALDIADGRRPRLISLTRSDRLESLGEAQAILGFARAQAARQARNLTHPQLCLDAIQCGVENGGFAGLDKVSLSSRAVMPKSQAS